jgi:hypothetical protein
MNTPVLIQVRNRITNHGVESPAVIDEWTTGYDQRHREPTRVEPADFGDGDSTGVQDLDQYQHSVGCLDANVQIDGEYTLSVRDVLGRGRACLSRQRGQLVR